MILESLKEPVSLLIDAFSSQGRRIERAIVRLSRSLDKSKGYALFERALSFTDRINLKSGIIKGDFFAPWNFIALFSLFYLYMAMISPIPIINPASWAASALIFLTSMGVLFGTAKLTARRLKGRQARSLDYEKAASAMLFAGSAGIILNFLYIGITILQPAIRLYFHNTFYQFFFIVFIIGLALTATKADKPSQLFSLAAYAGALTFLTGFRTDFLISVGPVLLTGVYTGIINARRLIALLALILPGSMLITMLLLASGDSGSSLNNLITGRAGFTMYALTSAYENVGLTGTEGGGLILNSFTQFFSHRIMIGGLAAEYSSMLPRYFTSTFAGPLLIDGGILEVLLFSVLVGGILGALYGLRRHPMFAAFYSIAMWYTFIWVETGPIQFYFLAMHLLFGGLAYVLLTQTDKKKSAAMKYNRTISNTPVSIAINEKEKSTAYTPGA